MCVVSPASPAIPQCCESSFVSLKTEKTGQNFAHITLHSAGLRQKTFCGNDTTLHLPPPLIDVRCFHIIHPRTRSFLWQLNDTTKADFLLRTVCTEKHTTNTTRNHKMISVWTVWPRDRQDDDFRSRSIFKASKIHFSVNEAFQNREKKRSQFRSWVVIAIK